MERKGGREREGRRGRGRSEKRRKSTRDRQIRWEGGVKTERKGNKSNNDTKIWQRKIKDKRRLSLTGDGVGASIV